MFSVSLTCHCSKNIQISQLNRAKGGKRLYFIVHLTRQGLELNAGIFQTAPLDVFVRRVSQDFVQRDDVARNLFIKYGHLKMASSS